ncbi:MAG: GNAT family N-acetyltransferase [Thermoguttaceae bacterium]
MDTVRLLDNASPADRAAWLSAWQSWPEREPFAHPDYVRLFARPVDRVMCAAMGGDGRGVLFPFVMRPLEAEPWTLRGETACDLVTPYGYGGAFAWNCSEEDTATFWRQFDGWAAQRGVVSSFARLSVFPDQQLPFAGEVVADRPNIVRWLDLTPDQLWQDFEHKVRKNVNCARRSGVTIEVDTTGRRIGQFLDIYYATMDRRGASNSYYFPREFFDSLMRDLPGQFVFFHALSGGRVVSTELVLLSAEHMYSFLGGTLADAYPQRPNDLLKYEAMLWGCQAGKRAFVLGGGYDGEDGIFRYKKSFAPRGAAPFCVGRRVHDQAAYDRLLDSRRQWAAHQGRRTTVRSGFFPAYRAVQEVAMDRIYLSSPHMSDYEKTFLLDAFDSNWIAPLGPHVDAFEKEFAAAVGAREAVALSCGTAAIHLGLLLSNVGRGDEVLTSTMTFAATANAIAYVGAEPVFIDSDETTWNMDPQLLVDELRERARRNRLPKAVVVVDLYGHCADYGPIRQACQWYDVPLIEDAAEALGATYDGHSAGTFGQLGIFSFNGNKIITASGGGMLVTDRKDLADRARFLATQARDPAPHYQHSEIGYNYRMSNLLAAVGRGQLRVLDDRVERRRANFQFYRQSLGDLPGIGFMPEHPQSRSTRWLTCITVDPRQFGATRDEIRLALEAENIESRPTWKPMHLQPVFSHCRLCGGAVAERIFEQGLCLPSGSNLSQADLSRVVDIVRAVADRSAVSRPAFRKAA